MKNNLKIPASFTILFSLAILFVLSGTAPGWNTCNPPCGPCQTCQGTTCVNNCLSYLCQTCVNGVCRSACNSSLCQVCVNGVCRSACNPDTQKCANGQCVPWTFITYTYDEVDNRISMTDPTGTTSYTYDYLHRLTSVTNPDSKTIGYQYDSSGNRIQLTDPAANITTYTYNGNNQLTGIIEGTASTTYQYDSLGRQTQANYPNGTYTQYTYNTQRNWLASLVNKNSTGTVLSSFSYSYDNKGNRLSVTENDGSAVSYTYDDIYQITSETRTGANPYTITYQYDGVGNRTEMVKGAVTTTYTYNNNNQLLTETTSGVTTTYSYDLNGNLLSKVVGGNTTGYTWDWNNHPLSVSEPGGNTLYEYDGIGTRISKTQSGVKTKYINDAAFSLVQVLMETDNTGTVQAVYNYGNDLISMNRAGVNSYYHYDGSGSTRQMTNSSDAVVASYTYDGYGNLIASSGSVNNAYGFTGQQQFNEADGLVFLRARYYKPSIGRFISRDPIGYHGGLNLYEYVTNNPVNAVDPLGLKTNCEIWREIRGGKDTDCFDTTIRKAACDSCCGEQFSECVPHSRPFPGWYECAAIWVRCRNFCATFGGRFGPIYGR